MLEDRMRYMAFRNYWKSISKELKIPEEVFLNVIHFNTYNKRAFFNNDRLISCLEEYEGVKHMAQDPLLTGLAVWMGNLDYDFNTNKRSADKALQWLEGTLSRDKIKSLRDRIDSVSTMAQDNDSMLLYDINLAYLAAPLEIFRVHLMNLNKDLGEERTIKFLVFEDCKTRIYYTDYFHEKYDAQARRNLMLI